MDEHNDYIIDLRFTHPTSIYLLLAFPMALIMDYTYKTNRYQMPLLVIVGVTLTNKIFAIAFTYLGR